MSSGYAAAYADTINLKDLKKIGQCESLLTLLEKKLDEKDESLESFALSLTYEDTTEVDKDCLKIYRKIQKEFKKETGLPIGIAFHSSEDMGDCYDEVRDIYWYVENLYEPSKAYKKFKRKFKKIRITRSTFVQYG